MKIISITIGLINKDLIEIIINIIKLIPTNKLPLVSPIKILAGDQLNFKK